MTTIVTINASDQITSSRADLNTNFTNLNSDKIETSYLDTDTALTANSDTKIATQKAVKAYVDSGGNQNASETTRGIVEEATDAEVTAGTATGATGAKLFVTPAKLATRITAFTYLSVAKAGISTHDNSATGDQTIAHGLGKVPVLVKITSYNVDNAGVVSMSVSTGVYDGTTQSYIHFYAPEGNATSSNDTPSSGTGKIILHSMGSNVTEATIAISSTNITLTWSKTSSPTGTANFLWEAIA